MAFGEQVGSVKKLKREVERSSTGFIKFIPQDGNILVRFLTEPDKWLKFQMAWDPVDEVSYPIPPDPDAPGGDTTDVKVQKRYLANALDIEADKVVPLLLPSSLVSQLVTLFSRSNTIVDRDYDLVRTGSKLNTSYQVVPEDRVKRRLSKYTLIDLEKVLEADYDQWRSGEKLDSKSGTSQRTKRSRRYEEDEDDDDRKWKRHPLTGRRRGEVKKRQRHRPQAERRVWKAQPEERVRDRRGEVRKVKRGGSRSRTNRRR